MNTRAIKTTLYIMITTETIDTATIITKSTRISDIINNEQYNGNNSL